MKKLSILLLVSVQMSLNAQDFVINASRVNDLMTALSAFKEEDNNSRVAFSDADLEGRAFVMQKMKEAGLEVSIDFSGNIIGRRAGLDNSLKPIVLGSHIDTVPEGGDYDGCVGSMAVLEIAFTLQDLNITTRHPLEFIIYSNEEGGVMGSRALAGTLTEEAFKVVNSTGYSMGEGIVRLGGDPSRVKEVQRAEGSIAASFELHIEQGANLYQEDLEIGIVEGIVGIDWYDFRFGGFANHAGTTPMNNRQDALLAAAKFIQAVNEVALSVEGRHVCTVGRIQALPGAPNVIPGVVNLSLEIRDLSSEKMKSLFDMILERAKEIATASNVEVTYESIDATGAPAMTDASLKKIIEAQINKKGYSYMYLPSGAGHDSQEMTRIGPAAMIFIPSVDGISHSPREYSTPKAIAQGTEVLFQALLATDSSKEY